MRVVLETRNGTPPMSMLTGSMDTSWECRREDEDELLPSLLVRRRLNDALSSAMAIEG